MNRPPSQLIPTHLGAMEFALLIHGEKDRLIPLGYSQEVAFRMPNAELVVIKDGGHECLISHHRQVAPFSRHS